MARGSPVDKVLVTRPAGQAEGLCQLLHDAGYSVLHEPLMRLEALAELSAVQRQQLLDLDTYQHLIFVSANAVRYGMERIADYWPQLPVGLNWYGVGAATASLLRDYGIPVTAPEQAMNSEALLALPALRSVFGDKVLIVRGEGGRTLLREELQRRNARVEDFPCYRRLCPQIPPGELARRLQQAKITVIMISSGEGLVNLLALLSPEETTKFRDTVLIVPSSRVAQMAVDAGFGAVVTAANASDAAMLRALQDWTTGSGD